MKWLGVLATLPSLCLSLFAFWQYQNGYDISKLAEKRSWIQFGEFPFLKETDFTVAYELHVDGFALVMIVLTTVLATLAAIASMSIQKEWKGYFQLFYCLKSVCSACLPQATLCSFSSFRANAHSDVFLIGKWGYFEKKKRHTAI